MINKQKHLPLSVNRLKSRVAGRPEPAALKLSSLVSLVATPEGPVTRCACHSPYEATTAERPGRSLSLSFSRSFPLSLLLAAVVHQSHRRRHQQTLRTCATRWWLLRWRTCQSNTVTRSPAMHRNTTHAFS